MMSTSISAILESSFRSIPSDYIKISTSCLFTIILLVVKADDSIINSFIGAILATTSDKFYAIAGVVCGTLAKLFFTSFS